MKLAVTIDVEPDCSRDWTYSRPLAFEGVRIGIARRLEPLFVRLGVKPVYLVSNVVLEDGPSADVLAGLSSGAELGAHLHPEFIEPQKQCSDYAGHRGDANECFMPPDVEAAKLGNLTRLFESRFGRAPRSFRAGRFSAGQNTFSSLARLGYRVDTSVTPHVKWEDSTREQPVDYSSAPEQPYFIDTGPDRLLEVPVSIGLMRRFFRRRAFWLRPSYSSVAQMRRLAEAFRGKYGPETVLNMMFHNVEVLPGLSPYTATESDCEAYLESLGSTLSALLASGFESATLSEIYDLKTRA